MGSLQALHPPPSSGPSAGGAFISGVADEVAGCRWGHRGGSVPDFRVLIATVVLSRPCKTRLLLAGSASLEAIKSPAGADPGFPRAK